MTVESDVVLETVMALAWRQQGAFNVAQAEARGATRSWISRANARGTIERRAPAVYVLAGTDDTARQRPMVQVLAAGKGAMVTADSALGFWCEEVELPRLPQVVVPRSCGYRTEAATIWRSSDLHPAKPTVLDGVPSVGIARALLDASGGDRLRVRTARAARPRRGGRADASGPPRAPAAGRGPHRDGRRLARGPHRPRARRGRPPRPKGQARRDRQRDRLLQRAGWVVPRDTWDDHVADPDGLVAYVGDLVARRS